MRAPVALPCYWGSPLYMPGFLPSFLAGRARLVRGVLFTNPSAGGALQGSARVLTCALPKTVAPETCKFKVPQADGKCKTAQRRPPS